MGAASSNGNGYLPPALPEPTQAAPGSPEKIRVLSERVLAHQPLFHPSDAEGPDALRREKSSRYRGVHFDTKHGKWKAQISTGVGYQTYLGLFDNEREAFKACVKALRALERG
jgi:hypothetical protein